MPVGRIEYLFLEAMSFEEFLAALDETPLLELLRTYDLDKPFPGTAHTRLLGRLRDYMLVGGMPEAVRVFAEAGSFADAGSVHASILETYRDDFAKYGTRSEIAQLRRVYAFVPGAVGEKFKYSRVDSDALSRDVKRALELLVMARVVRRVTHTDATGLPLGATLKESAFKTYFLDVGLVNAACGIDRLTPEQVADARFVNEGPMAEQFIAQHLPLLAPDNRVFTPTYWLREGRANNAEVDFVQQFGPDIAPIEVKAGKSGSLKSLLELVAMRGYGRALRFDTNPPALQHVSHTRTHSNDAVEFTLLSLPLYMVEQTARLWRDLTSDGTP
jgi:predicted AAA+ superfamily ATPase